MIYIDQTRVYAIISNWYLASSAVTPAGSVHKFRGDNVGAVEEMMCVVCVDVTEGA